MLILYAGSSAFAGEVAFTARPTAVKDGGKVGISFAVSAPTDVEVAIVNTRGEVIRHLVAGVLGETPPAPGTLDHGARTADDIEVKPLIPPPLEVWGFLAERKGQLAQ